MCAQLQVVTGEPPAAPPLHPLVTPERVPVAGGVGMAEELHLHLLEFATAKREVTRRDLVAKYLAHLRDAEWHLHAGGVNDILELHEDALCRLGPQVRDIILGGGCADIGLEHQVEGARL